MMPADPKPTRRPLGDERGLSPAEAIITVDWHVGIGWNRMSWLARPKHWMVREVLRSPDGSASRFELAHYLAVGPLRLFIEPKAV